MPPAMGGSFFLVKGKYQWKLLHDLVRSANQTLK
jgi:hypothetical protein